MTLTRRSFSRSLAWGASSLALTGNAFAEATAALKQAAELPSLDSLARAKGVRFGSTLGSLGRRSRFHDTPYRELTARECSVLVPENETKWPQIQPDPHKPLDFAAADEMFAWAKAREMVIRGHCLLWMDSRWLPQWIRQYDFGAQPRAGVEKLLTGHVRSTCTHFGRTVESWDVVNEAVVRETGELHENLLSPHLASIDQIELMFRLAREHAPHAQLVYNDFMDWGADNEKHRSGVLKLLAELKRRGAPVQALGVQAHIGVYDYPLKPNPQRAREWRRFLDEAMAMDLDILVTEFDVNDKALPADIKERDAGVAAFAKDWLDTTLDVPRLNRFLCWGLADPHSWLQEFQPRADGLAKRCCPYDGQLQAKPLRGAIADALRAMPARPAR